jgi:hypothetical protein
LSPIVSETVSKKLQKQSWALQGGQLPSCLFSDLVSLDEKAAIAARIVGFEKPIISDIIPSQPSFPVLAIGKQLKDFVDEECWVFFHLVGEPHDWLLLDPASWPQDPHFQETEKIVRGLPGVNDVAQRGCRLADDFKVNSHFNSYVCLLKNSFMRTIVSYFFRTSVPKIKISEWACFWESQLIASNILTSDALQFFLGFFMLLLLSYFTQLSNVISFSLLCKFI